MRNKERETIEAVLIPQLEMPLAAAILENGEWLPVSAYQLKRIGGVRKSAVPAGIEAGSFELIWELEDFLRKYGCGGASFSLGKRATLYLAAVQTSRFPKARAVPCWNGVWHERIEWMKGMWYKDNRFLGRVREAYYQNNTGENPRFLVVSLDSPPFPC